MDFFDAVENYNKETNSRYIVEPNTHMYRVYDDTDGKMRFLGSFHREQIVTLFDGLSKEFEYCYPLSDLSKYIYQERPSLMPVFSVFITIAEKRAYFEQCLRNDKKLEKSFSAWFRALCLETL